MIAIAIAAAAAVQPVTAPGPKGPLAGTFSDAGKGAPIVLVIPGSGPTDRDGNNPLGVAGAPYRLLAEALATKGLSSVRIDKRGLFGSKAAVADASSVTLADYASDTHSWLKAMRARTGASCLWVLGHSEGGLIALLSVQQSDGICGVIVLSSGGRKFGDIIREQLSSNPANAPVLDDAYAAIESLEARRPVDVSAMHPGLQRLFAPAVQAYMMDLMAADPLELASGVTVPMLVLQGEKDMQLTVADARALAAAQPKAKLVLIPGMNHVLKDVAGDDRATNLATYADPSLPVDSALVDAIAAFVKSNRPKGRAGG